MADMDDFENGEWVTAPHLDAKNDAYHGLHQSPQSYFEVRGRKDGKEFVFGKYDTRANARAATLRFMCQIPRSEEGAWELETVEIPF